MFPAYMAELHMTGACTFLTWRIGRHRRQMREPVALVWPRAYVLQDGSDVLDWGWTRGYVEDQRERLGRGRIYHAQATSWRPAPVVIDG